MWSILKSWLRARLNVEEVRCIGCEILERELEVERARLNLLLVKINSPKPESVQTDEPDERELKPIQTGRRFIPFAVRQQMIEANDNRTLELLKTKWNEIHQTVEKTEQLKSNEELEKEILDTDVLANAK